MINTGQFISPHKVRLSKIYFVINEAIGPYKLYTIPLKDVKGLKRISPLILYLAAMKVAGPVPIDLPNTTMFYCK
jgi:hypothetical protein